MTNLPLPGPVPERVGWKLRPKGTEYRLDDYDQRGREKRVKGNLSPFPEGLLGGEAPQPQKMGGRAGLPYIELHAHSCYSFREGASTPRELVARAAELGYEVLALTDRDGLYGAMEFAKAAQAVGVRPIIGADVTLQGNYRLVLLAETREGYANLCQLLSKARGVGPGSAEPTAKLSLDEPQIRFTDLAEHTRGLIALSGNEHGEVPALIAAGRYARAAAAARRYLEWFGPQNFFLELQQTLTFGDTERNRKLIELAGELGLGIVATNDVWYHVRERHRLHDVLVAIHHRTTLDGSHRLRHANSERYLKSPDELEELFTSFTPLPQPLRPSPTAVGEGRVRAPTLQLQDTRFQEAMANSVVIAERCQFDLVSDLDYEFPSYAIPTSVSEGNRTPDSFLGQVCRETLDRKYPREAEGISRKLAEERLQEELALIKKHGLAGFFLAYYDLLRLAGEVAAGLKGRDPSLPPDERPVGRGRGSSVSSIVCYLIGLSHIDPIANELFLGRFLNDELPSIPDIDLDFPRDIREELLKRIWTEFEGGRAALICAYSTYRGRQAVRDVGKALGLPAVEIDHLAKLTDSWDPEISWASSQDERSGHGAQSLSSHQVEAVEEDQNASSQYGSRLSLAKLQAPLWRDLVTLTQEIMGLPRHVTQHVGGVVLSARPLQEFVPLEPTRMNGRVMCQWDKDSVDDARMVKIDFLALGMLSLVDECLELIEQRHGQRPDLGRVDHEDRAVYDQICAGDTIGLFQIESRAQISTLAYTQPRTLDDLAVQVAIVRPGPIVSGAFKPYMEYRRRLKSGEPVRVEYLHPYLEPVLKDTVGVVLYQEQVVQVAMAIAGYTAGEADRLRRNLNRRHGAELAHEDWPQYLDRARQRGIPDEVTQATFRSILGFAAYGFPKSHAVAFALLAYESAWLRHYYPAEYYAALFNNQPMGFYSTEVIAGDARRHGLEMARPDINRSGVRCTVEEIPLSSAPSTSSGQALPRQEGGRIRLGLAEVKSVGENLAKAIVAVREETGTYCSVRDCADRVGLAPEARENLIFAGAFDDLNPRHRRELLWESGLVAQHAARSTPHVRQGVLPLPIEQDFVALAPMTGWEALSAEYETIGLSPNQHAMEVLRPALQNAEGGARSGAVEEGPAPSRPAARGKPSPYVLTTSAELRGIPDGEMVRLAGLVTCRQRPSTAKGVVFVSLEDEYGLANVVVYARLFHQQRRLLLTEPFLIVEGRVQRQGDVVHIIAQLFEQLRIQSDHLIRVSHDFR